MKIYVINGYGGSGKTTFENMVRKHSKTKGNITSMVEIVKHYAEQMGWEGSKEEKDRKFLADLKDCLTEWADIPMAYVYSKVKEFEELGDGYCFIDAREEPDIQRIKKDLTEQGHNVQSILIDKQTFKYYANHADDNVMNQKYDITIMNDKDLMALDKCAQAFCQQEDI